MKKNYVLDTNTLIMSPDAIYGFDDNNVYITTTTLQELDSKKTAPGETGWGAREAIRKIEECRRYGKLRNGVALGNGGTLFTLPDVADISGILPPSYKPSPDNVIIATVKNLAKSRKEVTILVTNDVSMRINADDCDVQVQEYKNDRVQSDEVYTGRTEAFVLKKIIDELYRNGKISASEVAYDFTENEFITLKAFESESVSALAIYQNGELKAIDRKRNVYNVTPKNAAQSFALYALMAPVEEIPFVILRGEAGCAKTFLSLAAGLEQIDYAGQYNGKNDKSKYNKVLITRNNVTSDNDFGYLPGDIDDKMTPLLAPFYDNLESLIRGNNEDESNEQVQLQINDMFDTGIIKVCPLAYMRGRSITHSYLIVDEAQNSSRSQMRDIVTRAGKGTKIVICGDPKQIDNIHLDRFNNGLAFASERMKGSKLCAQILFSEKESLRSPLSSEGILRLEI